MTGSRQMSYCNFISMLHKNHSSSVPAPFTTVLPRKGNLSEVLCKPKIMPIKSLGTRGLTTHEIPKHSFAMSLWHPVTRIHQLMSLHWFSCQCFLSWNIGSLKLLERTVTCSQIWLTSLFHPNTAAIMESQLSQRSATLEQIEQMEKEFQVTQLRTMDVPIATLPNLYTFIDLHGLDIDVVWFISQMFLDF